MSRENCPFRPIRSIATSNINHVWASLLVEELVRAGVRFFCISPGSRSTPLTAAVACNPLARHHVHVDERGGAFMTLGYGRGTGRPAAWITTSGTAVANGLPAVVEAAQDHVPMLLLTADRPPELRDTGANQTIDQVKLFGQYVRWQMDLPAPTREINPEVVLATADRAVQQSTHGAPGPVHLNCMFRKPLAPIEDGRSYESYLSQLSRWMSGREPYTAYGELNGSPINPATIDGDHPIAALLQPERGLVIAGALRDEGEQKSALRIARTLQWPLIPDIQSGLRLNAGRDGPSVPYADQLLASSAFRQGHAPDIVLHLGGRIVSKRVRQFIGESAPTAYVMLDRYGDRLDAGHHVTHRYTGSVNALAAGPLAKRSGSAAWIGAWKRANDVVKNLLSDLEDRDLNEPAVARLVTAHLPESHGLCLASSMPVRDVNRYGVADRGRVQVVANRGASGIDGTVSTAAGLSKARGTPVTLLIGDLALLHDLNALSMLREIPVIVVVVNNDGGGIFHFLPIVDHQEIFEPFFGTPHGRTFEHAAAMFGLSYYRPENPRDFRDDYVAACRKATSCIIEVQTEREENARVHRHLEERIARAVERELNLKHAPHDQ